MEAVSQNWRAIVVVLTHRGVSSGANNVSHHRGCFHCQVEMYQLCAEMVLGRRLHSNDNKLGEGGADNSDEAWHCRQTRDLTRQGDGEHVPLKIGGVLCLRSSAGASILVLTTMLLITVGTFCSPGYSSVVISWDHMILMTLMTWNGNNTRTCFSLP